MDKLPREFYLQNTVTVAHDLIGVYLVRRFENHLVVGRIIETEAYGGSADKACHAYGGRVTPRTKIMYGRGGFAYIYFIYGMYYCMNVVTEPEGSGCAVLIRGLELVRGKEEAARWRYHADLNDLNAYQLKKFTNGPGKLCQALCLTKDQNGEDLLGDTLYITRSLEGVPDEKRPIQIGKRIGINYAQEAQDFPWRFYIQST